MHQLGVRFRFPIPFDTPVQSDYAWGLSRPFSHDFNILQRYSGSVRFALRLVRSMGNKRTGGQRMLTRRAFMPILVALIPTLILFGDLHSVRAQGTAFTFQGKLSDNGVPANNSYDMQFKVFDTAALGTGTQRGTTVTVLANQVTNSLFQATLDFGIGVFNGSPRYLEIGIRLAGGVNPYTLLDPRQPILSSPYAMRSLTASQADGLSVSCVNCITAANILDGTLTAAKMAPQQVVKSIGGLKDDVGITAGPGISIGQANNNITFSTAPAAAPPQLSRLTMILPGVTGGNADGSIEVYSYSNGLQNSCTPTSCGRAVFANLRVTKGLDRASYRIQQAAVGFTTYATVTLNFYSIDPTTQVQTLTHRVKLANALVRLTRPNLSPPQEITAAREEVEFDYSAIKWEYLIPVSVFTCWNLTLNTNSCTGL
jgi:type VI secretion system Hcp family effector